MHPIDHFASVAKLFEKWAWSGPDSGPRAARNGVILLTRLYAAALELPDVSSGDQQNTKDTEVSDAEWKAVLNHSNRLPLDEYGEIFNPLLLPPEEAVIASLADDIADIYRDVVCGLKHYRLGDHQEATWQWTTSFNWHWGEHITGAIRALHCWISINAPERLTASDDTNQ